MDQPIQTDVELLNKLLLGQLSVAEAERLSVVYADDSRLAALAEAVGDANDTLLTDLRNHQTQADPHAERLIDRLKQRLRSAVLQASAINDTIGLAGDPSAPVPALPENLEYFRIQKVLGEGGMGTVYLADDTRLGRKVALKTLKRELAVNPAAKDRFLREARSAAQLEHDHVIPIYYVGEANGIPFLAMPFLVGEPLDVRIRREQASGMLLPISETIQIVSQIASGLAVAHARGLIHRDIKPANVWLEAPSGRVKILDFGLARSQSDEAHITVSGTILGTPAYMAPEQARGLPVDHRADLFSLGCILYEMLAGNRPFSGRDTMAILTSLALDNPPAPIEVNLHCPESLSLLTMQMLEKHPESRTASAKVIVDALTKIGASNSSSTAILSPNPFADIDSPGHTEQVPEITPKLAPQTTSRKRQRVPIFAIAVLLALIGVGIGFSGTIFRLATNQGELVIEVDDKDVEVKIVQNGVVVQDKTNKREFTLTAGKGEIEVLEKDGVKVATKTFELTRNGKTTVRVTLEDMADARKPKPKPKPKIEPQPTGTGEPKQPSDPDRKAAEYVLSIGGVVGVNGEDRFLRAESSLPREAFQLTNVGLVNNTQLTDAGMAIFKDCKNLMGLDLRLTRVTDAGLAQLKDCKNLTSLQLHQMRVTDEGLANFKDCKNLIHLQLSNLNVTDAGLAHFKDCKNLSHLDLAGSQVTDAGLAYFKECKNLSGLYLSHTRVGGAGLINFKDCENLAKLDLWSTKVSDAGLAHFKNCKNLVFLILRDTPTSDTGLAYFKDCKNLTRLDLNGTQATDRGLAHFEGCKNLTVLGLEYTKVSDAGLAHLKDLTNLQDLSLTNTQVSDAGLDHFKDLKNLAMLRLQKTKITAAGIDQLAKALPKCKIEWDGGVIEPKQSSDPDRKAAEWVLKNGGSIEVATGNPERVIPITTLDMLPGGSLKVIVASISRSTDDDLELLRPLERLHLIRFFPPAVVTDAGLERLSSFPAAASFDGLRLVGQAGITDAGLVHLKKTKSLRVLELQETMVSGAGLGNLTELQSIASLWLDGCKIGDTGLEQLRQMPSLQILGLRGTGITAKGLEKLRGLKVQTLQLGHNPGMTDAGLALLREMTELSVLDVDATPISDLGLEQLKGLKQLTKLSLSVTKVTADGVKKLSAALPGCKIIWDGGVIEAKANVDPNRKAP